LPKYQPTFTTEELEEARQVATCHQAPYVQVQRAKMVLALAQAPEISNPELGRHVDAHANTVFKWRKEWSLHGFQLDDHPRSGRPPIFSPDTDRGHQSRCLRTAS
jgi:transposase